MMTQLATAKETSCIMVNGYDRSLARDWLFLCENDFFS